MITEWYQRGVEARKLLDDPQKLADRIVYLERVAAEDVTDMLSRKELSCLKRYLKGDYSYDSYRRLWSV